MTSWNVCCVPVAPKMAQINEILMILENCSCRKFQDRYDVGPHYVVPAANSDRLFSQCEFWYETVG